MVEQLLKRDANDDIKAASIDATINPCRPGGIRRTTSSG
jgi:hypothetical protein